MLSYRERQRRRAENNKARNEIDKRLREAEAAEAIERYVAAAQSVYGHTPKVTYRKGRFYGVGTRVLTLRELYLATDMLRARVHEIELDTPAEPD